MTYRRIALASAFAACLTATPVLAQTAPPPGASSCSGCHPPAPISEISAPPLKGLSAEEIATQMRAYRAGQNSPTVMDRIAKGFSDNEIAALAAWFAAQR